MTLRILNTRPAPQNHGLTALIEKQGWVSIECPLLAIEYIPCSAWLIDIPSLSSMHQIIFTSQHAVYGFLNCSMLSEDVGPGPNLQVLSEPRASASVQNFTLDPCPTSLYAIGESTAKALRSHGIAAIVPSIHTSEGLLQCPELQNVQHLEIMLIKGVGGRDLIEKTLSKRGAKVHVLDVYQRNAPHNIAECIVKLWQDNGVDVVLYTSEESMDNILKSLEKAAYSTIEAIREWLFNKPALVISKRLALTAQKKGFSRILLAEPATILGTLMEFNRQQGNSRDG